jgi:probable O-glycosylation ligase (exosortase A-associated)
MSGESKLFDYEPLKRPRRSPGEEPEDFSARGRKDDTVADDVLNRQAYDDSNSRPEKLTHQISGGPTEQTSIKAGHGVSFAGLFVFTFLLFFRPYELSPSLAWLSKSALITAIITLLFFIPTQLGLENKLTIRTREVNCVLILLVLGLMSVPLALDPARAWYSFVDYLKVVAMFIVMVNVLRTRKRLNAIFVLITFASCILSVAAVHDYISGNIAIGGDRINGAIGGLFENPNDLALHFVTFLPIVIGLGLGARSVIIRIVLMAVVVSLLVGTVATLSRGGFIGLIFVVGTLAWRLAGRNRVLVGGAAVLFMILFLFLAPGAYRERIATTADASATARTGELKRSVYIALRHPVFGVGMDNFILFSNTEHATHNAYTQVASEIGFPAAVIYVLFLIASLKRIRRIPNPRDVDKKERKLAYLAVGLEASLVGYMVTSFFASVAYLWYVYYLAAYVICIGRMYQVSVDQAISSVARSAPTP